MGKKKSKKVDKPEADSKLEEETKIEENKQDPIESTVEEELKQEEIKIVEEVSTVLEPTLQETVSTIMPEETLYLSSIGENNESVVQMMPEMIIPGTLTETQVSLPVDNNSTGSDDNKEPEVQQDEVVQQIPPHDLHVPAAQFPKIIEEEEDDSLSQAEFIRMQEAQNRALRLKQEEVERFRVEQEEIQRKEMMRREIEKNKSHFVISSNSGSITQQEAPKFQPVPQRIERSHLIVEESKEYQLPINKGNQESEEEKLTLKKTQKENEEDDSAKYSTLQKVGAGLAIAALIVYTGAKFLMKKTPKKIL